MQLPINAYTILAALIVINLITWLAYAYDKRASQRGGWRTPENTLHLLALLGGSPTAFYAQRKLRHKIKKTSFQIMFCLIVVMQVAIIVWFTINRGS